ncbi:MAG TPA: hypothetical protein PL031_06715 [Neisseria sp.]|nr:hypothetical protein [Neisseria sp.]
MDFPFAWIKVTALKWREMAQIKAKALVKIGKPFQTACLMLGYGRLKTSAPGSIHHLSCGNPLAQKCTCCIESACKVAAFSALQTHFCVQNLTRR